jgi:ribosome-binding protein aMBF1 (putative translation factor)
MDDAHGATHPAGTYARVRQRVTGAKEKAAKSGNGGAFDAANAAYVAARSAEGSGPVLNAADITGRLSRSLLLARHQRGLSQERLATLCQERGLKVRRNEIRRWEHGDVRISERNWLILVAILDHDLSWWLADHDAELAKIDANHVAA